jgi:two-component system nitrate/nitrite response regulator NarL
MMRVLVVAPIRVYRDSLSRLLTSELDVEAVITAVGSEDALARAKQVGPHVVVVDVRAPDGLAVIRALCGAMQHLNVVGLGVSDCEEAVACAEAGVSGIVSRDASAEELIATLRTAAQGEAVFTPRIAAAVLRRFRAMAAEGVHGGSSKTLTSREVEVASLIEEGLSNKQIAQRLCIETATVKNHVHNILEKLEVHRRGEAVVRLRALREGNRTGLNGNGHAVHPSRLARSSPF